MRLEAATFEFRSKFMDSLLPQVQEIFRDVFDQPDLIVTRESNASTIDDWDSLAHINLVTAIEKTFKIKFALGELQELKNVGDLLDLAQAKMAAK
jgi:acyl carrier protein